MDVNEANLICPYCGASYRARDTTCPKCGKALSPTGYAQYSDWGTPEPPDDAMPAAGSAVTSTGIEGNTEQRVVGVNQRIDRTLGIILWGVIAVAVLFFIFSHLGISITPRAYPTNTPVPPVMMIAATPTPVYQPDPNVGKVKVGYVRVLGTSAGTLVANIYDLGTGADPFPPPGVFGVGSVGGSGGAVVFDAYTATNTIVTATKFTRYELPYWRGSVLLPVVNDVAYGDSLIILTSADITTTQHYPSANFIIAGQLIAGFDVLDRLTGNDRVGSDEINPLAHLLLLSRWHGKIEHPLAGDGGIARQCWHRFARRHPYTHAPTTPFRGSGIAPSKGGIRCEMSWYCTVWLRFSGVARLCCAYEGWKSRWLRFIVPPSASPRLQ
jgi:hypothetical protein